MGKILTGVLLTAVLAVGGATTAYAVSPKVKEFIDNNVFNTISQEKYNELKNNFDELTRDKVALESLYTESQNQLASKTRALNSANANIANLNTTISNLQAQLTAKTNEVNLLTTQLTNVNAELETKTNELTVANADVIRLQSIAEGLYQSLAQEQLNNEEIQTQLEEVNTQLTQAISTRDLLQSQVNNLTTQKNNLQNEVAEKTNAIASLNSQITTLQSEKATLQSQVNALTAEKSELETLVEQLQLRITELESQIGGVEETPIPSEGLEFTLNADGQSYSVKKGTCTDRHIVIPSEYEGLPVTSIAGWAFYDCSSLTDITIPNSITSIGAMAFGRTNLIEVVIPSTVINIDISAFNYCPNLQSINVDVDNSSYKSAGNCLLNKEGTELILGCRASEIPESVIKIGACAFRGAGIRELIIPGDVEYIGNNAFDGCDNLYSIDIQEGVTDIGHRVFMSCPSLTDIVIPNSVTFLGEYCFSMTNGLSCTVNDGVKYVGNSVNPYLVGIGIADTNASTIVFNDNTKFILFNETANSTALETMIIPNGVIGFSGFQPGYFPNLTYTTSAGIKYIGNSENPYLVAVEPANNMTISLIFNEGTKFILDECFHMVRRPSVVELPSNVISIPSISDAEKFPYTISDGVKYIGNSENPYIVAIGVVDSNCETITFNIDTQIVAEGWIWKCTSLTTIYAQSTLNLAGLDVPDTCQIIRIDSDGNPVE